MSSGRGPGAQAAADPSTKVALSSRSGPEVIVPPADIALAIACSPDGTRVTCQDSVTIAADEVTALLQPLNYASMTGDELSVLGPDASTWIAFARMVAGVGPGAERVYVDGMPILTSVPA